MHMNDTTPAQKQAHSPAALIEQIESRITAITELFNEIDALRARNDQRTAELDQREAAITRRTQELEACAAEMAQAAANARRQEEAAQAELQAARQRLAELERQNAGFAGGAVRQLQDVVGAVRQLEQMQENENRIASLESELTKVRQSHANLESALREAKQTIDTVRSERDETANRAAELESALRDSQRQTEHARSEREAASRRIAELESALHAHHRDAEHVRSERDAAQERISQLEPAIRAAAERLEAAERRAATAEGTRTDLENKLREATSLIDELKAETRGALRHVSDLEASLQAANAKIAQIQSQAGEGNDRAAALETAINQLKSQRDDLAARVEALQDRLTSAQQEAETARRETDSLREELTESSRKIEATVESSRRVGDDRLERRKARLALARRLLRDRSYQLSRAVKAVEAKVRECEQVLEAREHVTAAARAVQRAEKRIRARAARNKAGVLVAAAVATLIMILALSWAVAGHFFTPTYLARIELVPDTRGRELAPEHLEGWQAYHESLLRDPIVTQAAAERMARRGITSLADPGALRERLNADLRAEVPKPGRFLLELQGQGHERTRRILETYAATIVSHANASRERRPDGAATVIAVEASIVGEPLEDSRPVIAAGLTGVFSIAAFLGWLALWMKLRKPDAKAVEEAAFDVEEVTA